MYEYDANVLPVYPDDYTVPTDATDVQLLEQVINNQSKELEFMYYQLNKANDRYKEEHDENTLLADKLDTLISQGSTGDSAISDSNTQILQKLDTMNNHMSEMLVGSNTVFTYGVFYIPLAIICFLLWRFFATFLRSAR